MAQYKTPGVYVEEISKFPPSVAGVSTAIPAFIGYTERQPKGSDPQRISSLIEYEAIFGGAPTLSYDEDVFKNKDFVLYDSMRLFFDNGGSVCYVSSVGTYDGKNEIKADAYTAAIDGLKKIDEVTLLLFPDAAMLLTAVGLADVQKAALTHCGEMKDRFAILDVQQVSVDQETKKDTSIDDFRNGIGMNNLSYGAAYYPYLKSSYTKEFSFGSVMEFLKKKKIEKNREDLIPGYKDVREKLEAANAETMRTFLKGKGVDVEEIAEGQLEGKFKENFQSPATEDDVLCYLYGNGDIGDQEKDGLSSESITMKKLVLKQMGIEYEEIASKLEKSAKGSDEDAVWEYIKDEKRMGEIEQKSLALQIPGYQEALAEMQDAVSLIPPSGAIAGIIAATDAKKGVWQAPANVSIASVKAVDKLITDTEQEGMNVDANAGKSINAIRKFAGKGILVWGARTLDGNSAEWRYISVRRLFNYIEESIQKSTAWAVFQPNDTNTWVKVQCQIENFLTNLWRDGALAGATTKQAFYVGVGLGVTMTSQDILDGNLIVEVGVAAVRPAEFVVLKFSHKVQE